MNYPRCPHCGFRFEDEHIWHNGAGCEFPTEPGGKGEECFFCPKCGKELYVQVDWMPTYIFVDDEGKFITYT